MQTHRFRSPRTWGGLPVAFLAWGLTCARAPAAPAPFAQTHERAGIEFRMEQAPWKQVLNWLAEQTGKQVICAAMPTGSFTFGNPKGVRMTLPQIIHVIDSGLRQANYRLIERERNFVLVPADE